MGSSSIAILHRHNLQQGQAVLPFLRDFAALMMGVALAGFTIGSVQGGMYVVSAHIYPTECRASGVGWALGAGRLGGIVSSFASEQLLASEARETGFFV